MEVLCDQKGVAHSIDRSGIDNDAVEILEKAGHHRRKVRSREHKARIRAVPAGGDEVKILDAGRSNGLVNGCKVAEIIAKAQVFRLCVEDLTVERGTAQVGVDQERFEPVLSEGGCAVEGCECLALGGRRARDKE